jgi:isoleucyl-tRNA synthetase
VLHVAPAFGEADLGLAQAHGIPVLTTVKPDGHLTEDVPLKDVRDVFFKEADGRIIEFLAENGQVYSAETFTHTYPFCYRCDSPLLYYAITTWFVGVSQVRDELLRTAEEITWQPDHIKRGRFGKWLEGARDWAISRNRYWGAPMPIWMNVQDPEDWFVVTSLDELVKLAKLPGKPDDLHRPGIDDVVIEKDGKTYRRIEEVFDCWFESGSMPVAQQHFPFENKEVFEDSYPADFIQEGLDQTRLWFYVLHVLNTIAFGKPAYRNVLVNGIILAADGQKLSKRLRNYPPVEEVFATEGADTLRFYLLGNDQAVSADYMRFNRDAMRDIQRNVFGTLWNTYSFLSMYADIDGWQPKGKLAEPKSENVLDQWILARLNQTVAEVTVAADGYLLAQALRPIRGLVDDLSNWYVRRSRRRFWKSEDDGDKQAAYATLHFALARTTQLLAPWSPFVADKLWRGLTEGMDEAASVHLSDWPAAGEVDANVLSEMLATRAIVTDGLAIRGENKIKIRQPLSKLTYRLMKHLPKQYEAIIAEEVNVKDVVSIELQTDDPVRPELDTEITPELRAEGVMRDVVRHVQQARKEGGLQVDDRIVLTIDTDDTALNSAIKVHEKTIKAETLAVELKTKSGRAGVPVKFGEAELYIEVAKSPTV